MALPNLRFDNRFVRELPADPELRNSRRKVYGAAYSRVQPTPVAGPRLLGWSAEVAEMVGLPTDPFADDEVAQSLAEVFAGNRLLPGMDPYAACYGGHQFGHWAEQLGDGRAITLGEVVHDGARLELQLKGAGPTPYSRHADGRAVLRSSLREFLCSEAMHHLGVPTTRALSLVTTGDEILRDMFYDGRPKLEPGAVVCRVAPSFLRFGNFELPADRGEHDLLRALADHTIRGHFSELLEGAEPGGVGQEVYAAWFSEVCARTAVMIAHWMRVGFVHGVMNTDNMSILGLTIDYGPYGWLDDYDPDWTPNTTDAQGRRYRFGHQPRVAAWNLVRLAAAIRPLLDDAEPLQAGLDRYAEVLDEHSVRSFAGKLGIDVASTDDPDDPSSPLGLANGALALLQRAPIDMTLFWRSLADVPSDADASDDALWRPIVPALYDPAATPREPTLAWLRRLGARVREEGRDPAQRRATMHAANPKFVLRNYLAQLAIDDAEQGDPGLLRELLEVMRRPYDEQPDKARFAEKRPEWAKNRPGCSMLSCSS